MEENRLASIDLTEFRYYHIKSSTTLASCSLYILFLWSGSFQILKSSLVFHAVQFVSSLLLRQTQHLGWKMGVHRACFTTKEYNVAEEEDKVQLEHMGCTSTLDCRGGGGMASRGDLEDKEE